MTRKYMLFVHGFSKIKLHTLNNYFVVRGINRRKKNIFKFSIIFATAFFLSVMFLRFEMQKNFAFLSASGMATLDQIVYLDFVACASFPPPSMALRVHFRIRPASVNVWGETESRGGTVENQGYQVGKF